jgi:hypothetical protein
VGLVAHELAHSWSGNLVTNASGRTVGSTKASPPISRTGSWRRSTARPRGQEALVLCRHRGALKELGATAPGTRLHDPSGRDSSGIVYDKGATFLRTIERTVGRERFDAMLRSYFDRHAFQPMTSARFLADLRTNLVRGDRALEQRLMLDQWVYQPGLPQCRPARSAGVCSRDAAVTRFNAGGSASALLMHAGPRPSGCASWTRCPAAFHCPAPRARPHAPAVREQYAETLFAWLQLALANRYEPALPPPNVS